MAAHESTQLFDGRWLYVWFGGLRHARQLGHVLAHPAPLAGLAQSAADHSMVVLDGARPLALGGEPSVESIKVEGLEAERAVLATGSAWMRLAIRW